MKVLRNSWVENYTPREVSAIMVKKAVNSMTMKIAFCIKDNTQPAMLDDRFGRCNYFFIADSSGEILEKIKNPYKEDSQGAGIASA
jgi:hypothetical protein